MEIFFKNGGKPSYGRNKGWRLKGCSKNLARDPDFYAKIGRKGGKNGRTGGFAANPALARIAGAKGGRISRRTKKTVQKIAE
ncbi:general stress protein [Candidatus Minimicrobia vallesae]|uniref:general stress protein n=1 Tax=Candidatus Minimicrobia vallesae TaxID=2841264 RepID=UPI001E2E386A|nr:KGG domain-containing protein [Candidatus Minimicrobia vallesae]